MSEAPPPVNPPAEKTAPPRPRKPSPPGKAAGERKPSAGGALRNLILRGTAPPKAPIVQIDTTGDVPDERTQAEKLLEEAKARAPGFAISAAVHLVILAALTFVVVRQTRETPESVGLESAWLADTEMPSLNRKIAPVKIEAVKLGPNNEGQKGDPTPKPEQNPGGSSKKGTAPGPVAVKPVGVGGMFGDRGKGQRTGALERSGGGGNTERAVSVGLAWLARQQQSGGNWRLHEGYPDAGLRPSRTDTGATALALMAFLGAGHTHGRTSEHGSVVEKGLNWLKGVQKPDGDYHDHEELGRETHYYAHSQATIVMCEALAMTQDPALKESAERGVKFLLNAQQPNKGGWKFMAQNEETVADLAVTGWCLMALHTARAAGIDVPEESYIRGSGFLDDVSRQGGARYIAGPSDDSENESLAMTAEGLVCRQYLGWPKDHPPMIDGLAWIASEENLPRWEEGQRNVYAWYFAGQALHNVGGEAWKQWYLHTANEISKKQLRTGSNVAPNDVRGSWDPNRPVGAPLENTRKGGRLYLTAMSLLILELPYRHRPVYEE